ncbi:hypothetical protein ACFL0V_04715 [Nanoarchaeota archaeon]
MSDNDREPKDSTGHVEQAPASPDLTLQGHETDQAAPDTTLQGHGAGDNSNVDYVEQAPAGLDTTLQGTGRSGQHPTLLGMKAVEPQSPGTLKGQAEAPDVGPSETLAKGGAEAGEASGFDPLAAMINLDLPADQQAEQLRKVLRTEVSVVGKMPDPPAGSGDDWEEDTQEATFRNLREDLDQSDSNQVGDHVLESYWKNPESDVFYRANYSDGNLVLAEGRARKYSREQVLSGDFTYVRDPFFEEEDLGDVDDEVTVVNRDAQAAEQGDDWDEKTRQVDAAGAYGKKIAQSGSHTALDDEDDLADGFNRRASPSETAPVGPPEARPPLSPPEARPPVDASRFPSLSQFDEDLDLPELPSPGDQLPTSGELATRPTVGVQTAELDEQGHLHVANPGAPVDAEAATTSMDVVGETGASLVKDLIGGGQDGDDHGDRQKPREPDTVDELDESADEEPGFTLEAMPVAEPAGESLDDMALSVSVDDSVDIPTLPTHPELPALPDLSDVGDFAEASEAVSEISGWVIGGLSAAALILLAAGGIYLTQNYGGKGQPRDRIADARRAAMRGEMTPLSQMRQTDRSMGGPAVPMRPVQSRPMAPGMLPVRRPRSASVPPQPRSRPVVTPPGLPRPVVTPPEPPRPGVGPPDPLPGTPQLNAYQRSVYAKFVAEVKQGKYRFRKIAHLSATPDANGNVVPTRQDYINRAYVLGGGTDSGAWRFAASEGVDLDHLSDKRRRAEPFKPQYFLARSGVEEKTKQGRIQQKWKNIWHRRHGKRTAALPTMDWGEFAEVIMGEFGAEEIYEWPTNEGTTISEPVVQSGSPSNNTLTRGTSEKRVARRPETVDDLFAEIDEELNGITNVDQLTQEQGEYLHMLFYDLDPLHQEVVSTEDVDGRYAKITKLFEMEYGTQITEDVVWQSLGGESEDTDTNEESYAENPESDYNGVSEDQAVAYVELTPVQEGLMQSMYYDKEIGDEGLEGRVAEIQSVLNFWHKLNVGKDQIRNYIEQETMLAAGEEEYEGFSIEYELDEEDMLEVQAA